MALIRRFHIWTGWVLGGACLAAAQAASISQVVPQGSVNEVRQVVVQTSDDAVRLGNAQAAAPVQVQCTPAQQGTGRWNNAREWVWQLEQPIPAGTRCQVVLDKTFKLPAGGGLTAPKPYQFEVAGPHVIQIWPQTYERIDESQTFVLQLNGPATPQSLSEHVYCRASDVGQQIPVNILSATQTAALRDALNLDEDGHYVALSCKRRMTSGAGVRLVYGEGVAMPSGVRNHHTENFDYSVREAFKAEMRCERERANAGCLPIRDVVLRFSEAIDEEQAKQVHLLLGDKKIAPVLEEGAVEELRFAPPFVPKASYRLVLPKGLKDDSGRVLANASAFPLTVVMGGSPPLVKFSASPFGVLERFAEGDVGVAVLPLTVRNVEAMDGREAQSGAGAQVLGLRLQSDADIIHWWNLIERYDAGAIRRDRAKNELLYPLPQPIGGD